MASKPSPNEIIADFLAAWSLEHDPAHVEVTYRSGWYHVGKTEAGDEFGGNLPYVQRNKLRYGEPPCPYRAEKMQRFTNSLRSWHDKRLEDQRIEDSKWEKTFERDGFTVTHAGSLLHEAYSINLSTERNTDTFALCRTLRKTPADEFPPMTVSCKHEGAEGMTSEQAVLLSRALAVIAGLAAEWNAAQAKIEGGE